MIRRARPKFLSAGMIASAITPSDSEAVPPGPYFDRGSSAFWFLLECLRARLRRAPLVAIQSFNCVSVLDAVLEAGCDVTLCDVKLDDLSMSLESLAAASPKPDVVLLLHYQGLRNAEHCQIAEFCQTHRIVLVEDLAHCTGTAFPLLGDFGIFSFAFDKPFTCLAGGQLVHGGGSADLFEFVCERHAELPVESPEDAAEDLRLLGLKFATSGTRDYAGSDLSVTGLRLLGRFGTSGGIGGFAARNLLLVKAINAAARVLGGDRRRGRFRTPYAPARLRPEKIELIAMQRREHSRRNEEYTALSHEAAMLLRDATGLPIGVGEWNRLSMLEPSGRLVDRLSRAGVQAGNYNWPVPLHSMRRGVGVGLSSECRQSEYASRNVVNIPVWSPEVIPAIRWAVQGWNKA